MTNSYTTPEEACASLLARKGMRAKLARELGLTPGALSQWERVPFKRVAAVSAATGIPASELRPDLAAAFLQSEPAQ